MIKKIIRKILSLFSKDYKISYSQNGEDILISRIFKNLKIQNIKYLDIGANHPKIYNNTYLLYCQNNSGICIEANIDLCKIIKKLRPRDSVLNIAISDKNEELTYFSFSSNLQNTFSKVEADKNIANGNKLLKTYNVVAKNLNSVIDEIDFTPDLISLDIEGFDEKVIKSFDFSKSRPKVWCIETIERKDNKWTKNQALIDFMKEKGYEIYGDTNINTIFVEKDSMKKITQI